MSANTTAGADTIAFDLTGATRTLNVSNALPDITEALTLDGSTQPGFAGTPIVELNGLSAGAGGVDGLRIQAANCVIRSLVINRFTGDGIEISTNGNNVIEGCYVGLNLTGAVDFGNTLNGILIINSPNNVIGGVFATQRNYISGNNAAGILIGGVFATNNLVRGNVIGLNVTNNPVGNSSSGVRMNGSFNIIGGSASGARNFISGNTGSGIELLGPTNTSNQVLGNYIGADLTGTLDRGNSGDGILISNSGGHQIGGSNPGEGNLISGNNSDGIELSGLNATNVVVVGNSIGTTADGSAGVANSGHGVLITSNSRSNVVGGVFAGRPNLIAFNNQDGIFVAAANSNTNNAFRGNAIFSNGDLGIDLGATGVTANDAGDPDSGANQLQNFPVLSAVTNTPAEVIIVGSLNSRPSTIYTLDFYSNVAFDPSGNGEGQTWVGTTDVTTAADSNVNFSVSFPIANLIGRYVTATATDPFGNTSEFATNTAAISTLSGITFTVVNTNDSGPGSLRQAILDANAAVTTGDTINFAITNLSTTISLASPLPAIVDPVTINGYTQPGSAQNTSPTAFNGTVLVRIAGNSAGAGADGLNLLVGNCVVRGLMITGFSGDGIELAGGGNHLIEGNVIGLDSAGTDQGNSANGILINNSPSNLIGGASPGARNVISGNNSDGIEINGAAAVSSQILGNLIGTDQTGLLDVGNSGDGVLVNSAGGTIIGGANPGEGNLISGNNGNAIELSGTAATNNFVLGNRIGTEVTGTLALGNSANGVLITSNSRSNLVGGVSAGEANVIAFNNQDGISVAAANSNTNNTFRGNSIFANGNLGIDLGTSGITANDLGDPDVGANQLQNFPVLSAVTNTPAGVFIAGSLNSRPSMTYTLDFYSNVVPSSTGSGEGQTWFGATNLTTGADSNLAFTVSIPVANLQGRYITATATDPFGNTSEFATNVFAASTVSGLVFSVVNTNDSGPGSLRQAILNANAAVTILDTIAFAITNLSTTITPTSALPAIVDAVLIDGYTQPGAQTNSLAEGNNAVIKVELSGTNAPNNVDGLRLESPGSLVRGLAIVGFKGANGDGIEVLSADNVIEGNFIGLRLDGTNILGNAGNGILITGAAGNTIGGTTAGARNVISGNSGDGVELSGVGASNNVVAVNFIGTDAGGTLDRGNNADGVLLNGAPGNLIGGVTTASRNVISGNNSEGVTIQNSTATNNQVFNNYIGVDVGGGLPLGNSSHGVQFVTGFPSGNQIGSPSLGGNLIAFNNGDGVFVSVGTNNAIRASAIHNNGGAAANNLGIDLGANGVLANDFPDLATGANLHQNYPILSAAVANPSNTTVQGMLFSRPNTTYAVDFFSNSAGDPAGNGEGQKWLGATNLITDANGTNIFNVTVSRVVNGRFITATATDPFGNTSEFSPWIRAGSTIAPKTFTVINTNDGGAGSLREAILLSNLEVSSTNNLIHFNITTPEPHVISLLSSLPVPTEAVTIDGFTQTGASANTLTNGNNAVLKIRLDGNSAPFGTDGIPLLAVGGNVVRGLSITRFGDAIELGTNGNHRIEGNFLGLALDGVTTAPNFNHGVHANNSPRNVIGGAAPAARNVISGNNTHGVNLAGAGTVLNRVEGNFIGTDFSGTLDLGNNQRGVSIENASTNVIGGTNAVARNVISGNNGEGIRITGTSQANQIQGNLIGSDVSGATALGNSFAGVSVALSTFTAVEGNLLGGTNAGAGNLIAYNFGPGVIVQNGTNNAIRGNNLFSNTSLGIDLGFDGNVTANDPGDPDTGPNLFQNFPVLTAATITPANTTIQGTLNSQPNTTYQIDFFASVARDPVFPNGEGQQYLGSTAATTGADSNANFNVVLPAVALGRHITATATDPFGNTSEFSPSIAAVSTFPPVTFVVTNTLNQGPGSLRQAILNNNATPTSTNNLITFNIPGSGPHTIAPTSALPVIVEAVTIDGFTQPGSSSNSLAGGNNAVWMIRLSGTNAGNGVRGLSFASSSNIVRGLVINGFRNHAIDLNTPGNVLIGNLIGLEANSAVLANQGYGVQVASAGNRIGGAVPSDRNVISGNNFDGIYLNGVSATSNRVEGNFIGTDVSGMLDRGNLGRGIQIFAGVSNRIGGAVSGAGNLISGNGFVGISVSDANGTVIQGNFIGTDATGTTHLGNSQGGIFVQNSTNVLIGGTSTAARNLISGNPSRGIYLAFGTESTLVIGNYIGTDVTGTQPLANTAGVIVDSRSNTIGGVAAGEANVIAFNFGIGVQVSSGTNNAIRGNSIFANNQLGIDLGLFSGVTSNDVADVDTGPNNLQNFPILTNAVANVGNTVAQGSLNSRPSTTFQLDFFSNDAADPSGHGEGQRYLGTTNLTTDGTGNANFSFTGAALISGRFITATATDPAGNTSEFSPWIRAGSTLPPDTFTVVNTNDSGAGSLRQAILNVDVLPGAGNDVIRFAIPGSGVQTIAPLTPLPIPQDPITIDGFTQSGSSSNTLVEGNNAVLLVRLDGTNIQFGDPGLEFTNGHNVIRGLEVLRFPGHGVRLNQGSSNLVAGCLIWSNGFEGLELSGPGNRVGGGSPGDRNVISGNAGYGIEILNATASNNVVQGNFIGTDFAGIYALGNGLGGILVDSASLNLIGNAPGVGGIAAAGFAPALRNVISGNGGPAIRIEGFGLTAPEGNRVLGNFIGTDVTGTFGVTNLAGGLFLASANNTTIGGTNESDANLIAFNITDAVRISSGTNNNIQGNSMFANGDLGIDLGLSGITPNDPGDMDTGANQLQNFPVLTNAVVTTGGLTLQGTLNSRPNTAYRIDFYSNIACDPNGNGEGRRWLGSVNVLTGAGSNALINATLPALFEGRFITATATDPFGNTSEFSACRPIVSELLPVTLTVTNVNDSGPGSLRAAILANNLSFAISNNLIRFNIAGAGVQTIALLSPLPVITESVTIDGYTQPGSARNTSTGVTNNAVLLIRLDGTDAGTNGVDGLHFISSSNLVSGLVIVNFSGDGIEFEGGAGSMVEGSFIGIDVIPASPTLPVPTLSGGSHESGEVSAAGGGTWSASLGGHGLHFNQSGYNYVAGYDVSQRVLIGNTEWCAIMSRGFYGGHNVMRGVSIGRSFDGTAAPVWHDGFRVVDAPGNSFLGGGIYNTEGNGATVIPRNLGFWFRPMYYGNITGIPLDRGDDGPDAPTAINQLNAPQVNGVFEAQGAVNLFAFLFGAIDAFPFEDYKIIPYLSQPGGGNFWRTDAFHVKTDSQGKAGFMERQTGYQIGAQVQLYGAATGLFSLGTTEASNQSVPTTVVDGTSVPRADLSVTKSGEFDFDPIFGEIIIYTIVVTNGSPATSTNVCVTDELAGDDGYFAPHERTHGTAFQTPSGFRWNIGPLTNGEVATLSFVALVGTNNFMTNLATVFDPSGTTLDPNETNDASQVTHQIGTVPPDGDLRVTKSDSPDPAVVGSNVTYTITVTNAGPTPATNVQVIDSLPPNATVVSATSTHGSVGGSGSTRFVNISSLASGESAVVTIVVTNSITGSFTNTALVSSSSITDTNTDNNTASAVTTILPAAGSTIQFIPTVMTVPEGNTAQINGSRTGDTTGGVQGNVLFVSGSAQYGEDFNTAQLVPFSIPPGQTTFQITKPTTPDSTLEVNEDFLVVLVPPVSGATLGNPNYTRVFIVNDDGPPVNNLQFFPVGVNPPDGSVVIDWSGLPGQSYLLCTHSLSEPFHSMPGFAPPVVITPNGAGNPNIFGYDDLLSPGLNTFNVPQEFFRLTDSVPTGTVAGAVRNPDGSPAVSQIIRIGDSHQVTATDSSGNFTIPGVPAGEVPISFEQIVTVSNIVTGQIEYIWVRIVVFVDLAPDDQVAINVEVELPKEIPKPPCNCIPWCGIVGGTFDGVQKVVASGGKRGECDDLPVVVVTGPGGISDTLSGKTRQTYSPAANGTWKVISTICGQTKECTITLP